MSNIQFLEMAVNLALDNVKSEQGGPFGAVIVKNGKIIATGRNSVTATNDPTAHAEIQAIRAAAQKLETFVLNDCDLYTSCEPCPMCFGAIYWSRIRAVYYACSKEDAQNAGFDDQFIYEQLSQVADQRKIPMKQLFPKNYDSPFTAWKTSYTKVNY